MFWDLSILPIVLYDNIDDHGRHMTAEDADALATAMRNLPEQVVLRLDGLCDETLPAAASLLRSTAPGAYACWLLGDPAVLCRLLALCHGISETPTGVTLRIGVGDDLSTTRTLAHALFDVGVVIEVELTPGTDLVDSARNVLAAELGAWRVRTAGEVVDNDFPLAAFEIGPTGRARKRVGGFLLESSAPVSVLGIDRALDELCLTRKDFNVDCRHRPMTVRFPRADGEISRSYWTGGSMALGHWSAQIAAHAALGFDSPDEFRTWVESVTGDPDLTEGFPAFPGMARTAGVFQDGEQVKVVRPTGHGHYTLVLASWLAQGDRDNARAALGLQPGWFDTSEKLTLTELPPASLKPFVDRAAGSLAKALSIVVRSKANFDKRKRAAEALLSLGNPRARDAAALLAKTDPDIGPPVLARFGNRTARDRLARAKDPQVGLLFLEQAIEQVCQAFAAKRTGGAQ